MRYLRFPDEATAIAACPNWRSGNGWIAPKERTQIVVRGTIYEPATQDSSGTLTAGKALDGFHIDVITGTVPAAATAYELTPVNPHFDQS
ncbi:hypothetical protein [Pantoea stewartii]|uniref:Uncharacterized protein n=1 Tax=Pantoea stewartii subsp. stewartii DC283 TaxID=660596 RepID=H3RLL2_PANSE|nr:hypothetical protein [Pantoea stewartii]ARF52769.1 hypothetical protein DSJ_26540 [Pantoea stewartii subsp. stewartii DC283]EHT97725.1 hypothetical protein CKS_5587 [Pantoea stewartii subsp. stewartii DC283]KAB0553998.1 hypothetical protein F7Q90_12460 [Pantoea stewartii subsp. stewartii]